MCDDTTAIATEPMGIVSSDTVSQDQSWQQDHTDDLIDTTSILNILQASLSQLHVLKAMKSQKTASPLWKYIPFIQNLLQSQIQHSMPAEREETKHKQQLLNTLRSWNFVLLPVAPDGNCFFTSVALSLINSKATAN